MYGEEGIHGVPFGTAVVVFFIRKVGVGKPGLLAVEFVDKPDKGSFGFGIVFGPVVSVGDDQLRARGGQGRNLRIVGFVGGALMNGHPAFAYAPSEKVGGHLTDRDGDGNAVVNGRKEEGLGAAAGAPGHTDALCVDVW